MTDTYQMRETDLPKDMRFLLKDYPRDAWEAHPGFKDKTRHWLSAHKMFRRVAALVRKDTESYLDAEISPDEFAQRLSYFGGNLIGNLHGHHGWEDRSYFPELSEADPRFDAGLALLEQDHADLDLVLHDFTQKANRVIRLTDLDETQARDETGALHEASAAIEAFLQRHLSDEEDLAVPIILHHRLRG